MSPPRSRDPHAPLVDRAKAGDRGALESLLYALQPSMYRAVGSVLGGAHPSLEDVVQDSLLGFARALKGFRGQCSARSYATNIAVRTAIDLVRAESAKARVLRAVEADPSQDADPTQSPERTSILRASTQLLLEVLSPEQAEAMILRAVFGFSYEEMGRTLSVPSETARSRVKRARKAVNAAVASNPELAAALRAGRES
ncbi:MAG: RNA polymerase sigma factor [Myxococcota bacterium]